MAAELARLERSALRGPWPAARWRTSGPEAPPPAAATQDGLYRGNLGQGGCQGTGGDAALYSPQKWCINKGPYSGQYSDWACSAVLWYNRELSSTEYRSVEWWLKQVGCKAAASQVQRPARCSIRCRRQPMCCC